MRPVEDPAVRRGRSATVPLAVGIGALGFGIVLVLTLSGGVAAQQRPAKQGSVRQDAAPQAATSPRAADPAHPQESAAPGWSFGTAAFVYTSNAGGNSDLWLQTHPLGETIRLTDDPAQDHWASWFPDGSRLVFQTTRDGNREVYLMNADGSALSNLTRDPAQDLLPAVSPDGSRVLFFSDRGIEHGPRDLPGHLYVMDADGGNVERLTETPLTSTFGGDWSPDGRLIVTARDFGGDVDLVVLDVESGQERRIEGTSAAEAGGRFSPDGRRIAFRASDDDDESRIVVIDADGGNRREITRGEQHYGPVWAPDGRWLMITGAPRGASQFDVLVVSVDLGLVRPLVAGEADERTGSWRPSR